METQKLLIEIDVDSNQAVQRIVEQKTAIENLKNEKKELEAANKSMLAQENIDTAAIQRNKEAIVEKEAKIKNLTAEMRTNEKVVQSVTKTTKDETGAYQKLSLEYSVASQKAKDMAVVHGVNSEQAKKATAAAQAMDKQLKEVDKSVGQNQRNVGNYSSALDGLGGNFMGNLSKINEFTMANGGLAGSFQAGGQAVAGMGKQLLGLLANPIVAMIAAIAAVIMVMVSAVKQNGEEMEKVNQILAPFKTLLSAVMNVVAKVVGFFLDGAIALMKFGGAIASVITGNEKLAESTKKSMALTKEKQQIDEQERADLVDDAKLRLKTAELKKELAQRDKYTAAERVKMAREIDNLEKANMKDDMDRQIRRHNNLVKQYNLEGKAYKDLTAEQKDALRKSEADIYNIKAEYSEKTKKVGALESRARQEMLDDQQKANQKAEQRRSQMAAAGAAQRKKLMEDELKMMAGNIAISLNDYKQGYDAEKLLDADYRASKEAELQKIHDAEIALIDKKKQYNQLTIEEEKLARFEANDRLLKAQQQLNADMNAELVKKLDYEMSLQSITDKLKIVNAKLNEDEKYQISVDAINKKYEDEKKKIELTIADETDKNRKLELLNAQHNLDIATADKAHQDAVNAQKLADEQSVLESKYALMKEGIDKEFLLKQEALEKEKQERLKSVTAGSEAEALINQEYAAKEIELNRQKNLAKAQAIVEYAKMASEIASGINDFLNALGERELADFTKTKNAELDVYTKNAQSQIDVATQKYNEDVALLDEQLANKTISQEEYDAARKALDKNYADFKEGITSGISEKEKKIQEELDEKKAEIEYQAAKRQKALAIANAIIGGAAAVIAALATPFAGPVLAIAAGATAALQLAAIIATPIPDNRKGGSSGSSSSSSSSGSSSGYTPPNTSNTTAGIVSDNLSKDSGYTTSAAIDKMNTEMSGYVPVLILSDLTKVQENIKQIKIASEL